MTPKRNVFNVATNILLQYKELVGYLHYVPLSIALARALISSSFPRLHHHQRFLHQNRLMLFSHPQQTLETDT